MHFGSPFYLSLLLLLPVVALFFFWTLKKKAAALNNFAQNGILARISNASLLRQKIQYALALTALFFLILTAARPQFGTKLVEMKDKGADVVIVVDVSESMLAEDPSLGTVKPVSRLESAKSILSPLIGSLQGNRIGIIAFAGIAFWQCPLTLDISSVNMFLDIMDENLIPLGGTSIGSALTLAAKGLEKTPPGSKSIIIITDGEDHKSNPEQAAEECAKQGIKIYAIGFGNPNGEPIPLKDANGNLAGYKKNKKGEVVMSKLDEKLLMDICATTNGEYFSASNGRPDLGSIVSRIRGLDRRDLSSRTIREYEDRFQYPLFLALMALLAALFIPQTKRNIGESEQ